ncbi:hypothetical protein MRB53_012788 [Persea americana]|uniref:Uncharacterized protein n=1 Tax=Persea americana TaxID=3435 RepID=A0ACC2LYS6_PERAE|nr:hypothetical protein MRB53_012788 [Persea americana]
MEGASKPGTTTEITQTTKGLLESQELYQYILETSVYPREPEPLKEIREATANHPRNFLATAPDGGQLMALLLNLIHAKKTIEIGVFTGYSLLQTALVLPEDGKIIAIDPDREAYEIGLPIIRKAGVEHKIDLIESPALPILDKILQDPKSESSFDFAYVDADKDNYMNYHERLMKLVKVGGLIVYDNTLWQGTVANSKPSLPETSILSQLIFSKVEIVKETNKALAADSRIQMSQLPVADGVTICMRLY